MRRTALGVQLRPWAGLLKIKFSWPRQPGLPDCFCSMRRQRLRRPAGNRNLWGGRWT